jgi:ABC-type long-subunit fatty acid transport system fused permease/ATPase subunit
METSARFVGLVTLLALLPVLWYTAGRAEPLGLVAAVNVVIIAACVYFSLSPDETTVGKLLGAGQ